MIIDLILAIDLNRVMEHCPLADVLRKYSTW